MAELIEETETYPSYNQADRLRKSFEEGELDYDIVREIMATETPKIKTKLTFSAAKLRPFLPDNCTDKMPGDYILKALAHYKEYLRRSKSKARHGKCEAAHLQWILNAFFVLNLRWISMILLHRWSGIAVTPLQDAGDITIE